MRLLQGKIALVTGASRGIGQAIALQFAQEGALVAVHYNNGAQEALNIVKEITEAQGAAFSVQANLTNIASIETLFQKLDKELQERTGQTQFDILVNNAGVAQSAAFEETTEEQFDFLFDANVKGLFFTTQKAWPRIRDHGRIINLSSVVSRSVFPDICAYSATKGAVDTLTLHLAKIAGSRGITVNSLAPGAIDTQMNPWLQTSEGQQVAMDMAAIKRVGHAEDIANAALLLASDASAWITANYINTSGGAAL